MGREQSGSWRDILFHNTHRQGEFGMNDSEPMVFIVDDDDSVRKALKRLIKSVGMKAETFETANDFLSRPPHEGPCCLVLDIRMPGLSGLELQKELKDLENSDIFLDILQNERLGLIKYKIEINDHCQNERVGNKFF